MSQNDISSTCFDGQYNTVVQAVNVRPVLLLRVHQNLFIQSLYLEKKRESLSHSFKDPTNHELNLPGKPSPHQNPVRGRRPLGVECDTVI